MKNPFRNWFKRVRDPKKLRYQSNKGFWEYEFLKLHENNDLLEHIKSVAYKIAENENIPVREMSMEILNVGETAENNCCGRFVYSPTYWEIPTMLPRIELGEFENNQWTLIHELGHYFRYKRRKKQSEQIANNYIIEFFYTHLPPFFRWVYQITLDVSTKDKKWREYTDKESFEHYLECEKFLNKLKVEPIKN